MRTQAFRGLVWLGLFGLHGAMTAPAGEVVAVPGGYVTDWVGNTFEGAGENGRGRWVQNMIDEIEVTPDGTVITASVWDEAGRCTGLYRDGKPNTKLLQQNKNDRKAWGWGTAGTAVAAVDKSIFIVNTEGELMRFEWSPPDLDSPKYVNEVKCGQAVGLVARGKLLVVVGEKGEIQVRSAEDFKQSAAFSVAGATDAAIDDKGTLWLLAGTRIVHRGVDGAELPGEINDAGKPSAVSMDNKGRLIVCDDGPRQQVLFYELGVTPKLVERFGEEGGLRSGTPGIIEARKLYGLRGAGTDADGNLYVALCIYVQGAGTAIRSFDTKGKLRWQVQSNAFVDCYSFDPDSDGKEIYGIDEIISMDYSKPPGQSWALEAITLDHNKYPDDPRVSGGRGATGIIRNLKGRRLLFSIGQMFGGFDLYTFEPAPSQIARYVGRIGPKKDGGWAWEVDANGDVWHGDAPKKTIRRYRFEGWNDDGTPKYDREKPESWPWPEGFTEIARVAYSPATDTLYVGGYTPEKKLKSWGCIGSVLVRYDGWTTGKPAKKWTVDMPVDDEKFHPKSLDIAGDYVFTVQVKATKGKPAVVSVFKMEDGSFVGNMWPGPEVGGSSGWVDQSHGLRAFKRADGEYVVLVEEDFRGKNLLYRWKPEK